MEIGTVVDQHKPKRSAGTRTMFDVLRGMAKGSMDQQKAADLEAVKRGEERLVRCYLKPGENESRRHWKPGYLRVSLAGLRWDGSSRRWKSVVLAAGQWATRLRKADREDRVYKSFGIITCDRDHEQYEIGVPRSDVDLCVYILNTH
jgi:hypothetical protein